MKMLPRSVGWVREWSAARYSASPRAAAGVPRVEFGIASGYAVRDGSAVTRDARIGPASPARLARRGGGRPSIRRGDSSVVERLPSKQDAAGSNPVPRSTFLTARPSTVLG